jgi:NAD(P)-dependent dehydrogenase (short-subunit alcohol dehydrogenase family)
MPGIENRVVLVTGAGRGLGREHALLLGQLGAKVVVNDIGTSLDGEGASPDAARAVVEEIQAAGGEAVANHESVTDGEGAAAMVQSAVKSFGRIDGVVNNAGILRDRSFHKMDGSEWDAVLQVHLYGAYHVTRAAMPYFREQQFGRIVVTTSVTGLYGTFGQANYGAAKLGLVGLINTLAIEGARSNVLANAVSPIGSTRMTAGILAEDVDPAYASPLVAHFLSEECSASGEIVHAESGHYHRVRFMKARGVKFEKVPTPQQLADRWPEIMDMNDAEQT